MKVLHEENGFASITARKAWLSQILALAVASYEESLEQFKDEPDSQGYAYYANTIAALESAREELDCYETPRGLL
jgi:hypothetical protein